MIPHLIGFFIPSYLILSADFELKRPPIGVMLCSQPASLFNGELRWRKVKFVVIVKPRSRKRRSRTFPCERRHSRKNRYAWLPFLDTYRTMCLAPQPDFRRVLENVRAMQLTA